MYTVKRVSFYIGNLFIGVFSFYSFLYFWTLFSWGESFHVFSFETFASALLSMVVFLQFNYLLLRKEDNVKKHWMIAILLVIFSLIVIVSIIEYS
ncbi:hypothetical protein IM538_06790 [Cytobacillus suaedae]|nr:hypothetical protein IM538_06790 [Cytobacillus suaedae]